MTNPLETRQARRCINCAASAKAYRNHRLARGQPVELHSQIFSGIDPIADAPGSFTIGFPLKPLGPNTMNLDVNTLFVVTIYVEAILGLLLLFAWVQNTAITAVAWWGFADLLRAASVALFGFYGTVSELISIDLANAILFTAFAVTWTGARVFDHRKPQWLMLFGGAVLWLVLCRLPAIKGSWDLRLLFSSGIITAYTWATAY